MSDDQGTSTGQDAGSDDERERPLAQSATAPAPAEHVDVSAEDEVDPTALDIAKSTSSNEPPA